MIPKIIHCCWFGGPKTKLAEKCLASWRRFAPGFEIREWNEESVRRDLCGAEGGDGREFFEAAIAAKKWAMASDWLRMKALHEEGGIYLDLDSELVAPIDRLPDGEWVAGEWTASGEVWMNPGGGMALEKGSAVARHMLDAYAELDFDPKREMMTWINARLGERSLRVLDPEVMSPIGMDGKPRIAERTVAVHWYAMSWATPAQRILQWMSWHGMRRVVDALVRLRRAVLGGGRRKDARLFAATFWEEHCCECGMPQCFGTCGMFERGWHGRCVRVDGFVESIMGEGRVMFRRWGKIEAVWHGTLVSVGTARFLERMNRSLSSLWRILGPYHRALRWRVAAALGRAGRPSVWRISATANRNERLVAEVADAEGREILRSVLDLPAGAERKLEIALPEIEKGTLLRLFPADGEATGKIHFHENDICSDAGVRHVKCLAWDLDDTLWIGTLAEDGVDGCVPKKESVALVKELDRRGVVNSIVSRNDAEEALAALRRFGLEELFVFPQFGWGPKSDGIKALAREMNISPDAIAFVDDREEQRAEVAANAGGVRVYDAREIPVLAALSEFSPPISQESASRRTSYRAEMLRRRDVKVSFGGDAAAFEAASGLSFEFAPVVGAVAERCLELLNRTNQLNISGRRYSHEEFSRLLGECEAKAVRVRDRYGDYGTVGFVAMNGNRVVELCFSCRIAHRGVERRVLKSVADGGKLTADVVPTGRNAPIREILEEFL